jgi:histone demethylase JARID1
MVSPLHLNRLWLMIRYHGKCLKIARGKIKVEDKYTCPICDWRVKIPRDAARPKLEDLQDWQAEIPTLPFQPEEVQVLEDIISAGQEFRDAIRIHCTPIVSTPEEVTTQRFYLRKIEGADVLLAFETNFFRQELHKWVPVAPEAPPILEHSLSTRKPRPTKQQKLMAQLGIDNPEDLPVQLRTKAHVFKTRKASNSDFSKAVPLQPAPLTKSNSGKRSSAGNTPSTPTFSHSVLHGPPQTANPSELANPSPSFPWQNRVSGGQQSPVLPRSPIFRPATPNSAERAARAQLDPSLFSPSSGSFAAAALRETSGGPSITLASPMPESFGPSLAVGTPGAASATSGSNMDKLFAEYTTDGDKERNEAGEALDGLEAEHPSSPRSPEEPERTVKEEL